MPKAHIILESPVSASFRTAQVFGMFDVPDQPAIRHEWDVDIPVEGTARQVGLVVGPSGSGKTTIGRRLFPEALFHTGYSWPDTKAVVDEIPAGSGRPGSPGRIP
jgi:hypothetical protein